MDSNALKKRTKDFTASCLKLLAGETQSNRLFWHVENQLIRCATSVAANYRAACLGQSRAAFIAKLSIVLEESDECIFWLEIMEEHLSIKNEPLLKQVKLEAEELTRIFASARKTLQSKK